jgi:site-specific recombinase XerD
LLKGFILQLRIEGYSPRTIDTYHRNLQNFISYMGDTDIASVTPQDIRLFLAQVREPRRHSPANNQQDKDREYNVARSTICAELTRIRTLNLGKLP